MTDLLEKAVSVVRGLSPDMQDDLARMLLALADGGSDIHRLTPEEITDQDIADREEARGEYATDEEVRAIWAKHGL